jgi:hypothetical protein
MKPLLRISYEKPQEESSIQRLEHIVMLAGPFPEGKLALRTHSVQR